MIHEFTRFRELLVWCCQQKERVHWFCKTPRVWSIGSWELVFFSYILSNWYEGTSTKLPRIIINWVYRGWVTFCPSTVVNWAVLLHTCFLACHLMRTNLLSPLVWVLHYSFVLVMHLFLLLSKLIFSTKEKIGPMLFLKGRSWNRLPKTTTLIH